MSPKAIYRAIAASDEDYKKTEQFAAAWFPGAREYSAMAAAIRAYLALEPAMSPRDRAARRFAREIVALDTEMDRRSANPDDPGNAALWAERWEKLVEQAREFLAARPPSEEDQP